MVSSRELRLMIQHLSPPQIFLLVSLLVSFPKLFAGNLRPWRSSAWSFRARLDFWSFLPVPLPHPLLSSDLTRYIFSNLSLLGRCRGLVLWLADVGCLWAWQEAIYNATSFPTCLFSLAVFQGDLDCRTLLLRHLLPSFFLFNPLLLHFFLCSWQKWYCWKRDVCIVHLPRSLHFQLLPLAELLTWQNKRTMWAGVAKTEMQFQTSIILWSLQVIESKNNMPETIVQALQ